VSALETLCVDGRRIRGTFRIREGEFAMNDIGSIPKAPQLPQVVITLKPTGVPNQSQVNVQHFNLEG